MVDNLVGDGIVLTVHPYGMPLEGVDHLQVTLQPGILTTLRLRGETVFLSPNLDWEAKWPVSL